VAAVCTVHYIGVDSARATVGNRGTAVPITELDRYILTSMDGCTGEVFLLGSEAGRNYHRVPRTDGSDCVATSRVDSPVRAQFPQTRLAEPPERGGAT